MVRNVTVLLLLRISKPFSWISILSTLIEYNVVNNSFIRHDHSLWESFNNSYSTEKDQYSYTRLSHISNSINAKNTTIISIRKQFSFANTSPYSTHFSFSDTSCKRPLTSYDISTSSLKSNDQKLNHICHLLDDFNKSLSINKKQKTSSSSSFPDDITSFDVNTINLLRKDVFRIKKNITDFQNNLYDINENFNQLKNIIISQNEQIISLKQYCLLLKNTSASSFDCNTPSKNDPVNLLFNNLGLNNTKHTTPLTFAEVEKAGLTNSSIRSKSSKNSAIQVKFNKIATKASKNGLAPNLKQSLILLRIPNS